MKKIKYLLVLCIFAIITTGCVRFKANMEIKKNKSIDFSIIYALDTSLFGETGSLKEEDFAEVKKEGYTLEKYKDGSYEGFTISKKINNIDDISIEEDVIFNLSGMMEEGEGNKAMFKVVKGEEKNKYTANFKFDANDSGLNNDDDYTNEGGQALPDEDISLTKEPTLDATLDESLDKSLDESGSSLDDVDLSSLTKNMDLTFSVTLPNGAISSNATSKENNGKTLVWKLNAEGKQNIEFTFELDNNVKEDCNLLLYIGIGAGVLLLIIVVVILIVRKNKKKSIPTETSKTIIEEKKENN